MDKRVRYLLVYIVIAIVAIVVAVTTIIKVSSGETRNPDNFFYHKSSRIPLSTERFNSRRDGSFCEFTRKKNRPSCCSPSCFCSIRL